MHIRQRKQTGNARSPQDANVGPANNSTRINSAIKGGITLGRALLPNSVRDMRIDAQNERERERKNKDTMSRTSELCASSAMPKFGNLICRKLDELRML